ncbi:glycosyl hydrolase [Streptomyces sasae]|uniref:glycosyl hydrolase n=1 Tax=Streptomyces sasae TaxID=1266772 RepID=UPI002930F20E|nr:glycosyl hydrolase [Streptomyces sasae]
MERTPPRIARHGVPRRATVWTAALAVVAGTLLVGTSPAATAVNPTPTAAPSSAGSAGTFARPGTAERPLYRFWDTGGLMTKESVQKQVRQIKASGAGGFEANQLTQLIERAPGYDPKTMSWGTPAWSRALTDLLRQGKAEGLVVDQIYTPGWSAGTSTVSPDGAGSAKEISFGQAWLEPGQTFDGPVPAIALPKGVTKRELQSVLAYRCVSHCGSSGGGVPVFDPASAVTLTGRVTHGRVQWTAPASPATAKYAIVGAWMAGTGQTIDLASSPSTTYLVDHFSSSGFDAIKDYWDTRALTPQLRAAMKASGGSMFFDSLELNRSGEQVRSWTGDFLQQFQRRRGYSLVPYLAAVAVSDPVFDFSGDTGKRVREDYNQTLSDLFRDYYLKPLKKWAASLGLTVRGQAYSSWGPISLDTAEMATLLDIPEGEDLSFNDGFTGGYITTTGSDMWRSVTSAGAQAGRKIISSECCTLVGNAAVPRKTLLAHVNQQFSVGVNQIVWHGWADQSPGAATAWPGFSPFGSAVSDVYGPQNPTFADDTRINTYVGRLQTILRRGQLRNDIAIYRDDNGHNAGGANSPYFTDQSLAKAGYTYGFMNDTLIADPAVKVSAGRLDASGLGYKAFVVDNTANVNTNPTLDLSSARRILSWAKAGLPVIVVGDIPDRVRGNHPAQDAALRSVTRRLLATPGVRQVSAEKDVLQVLHAAKVHSSAAFDRPAPLVTLHRRTADTDYYYLFNSGDSTTTTGVTLEGHGTPYRYDGWTGTVAPIAQHRRTGDAVALDVTLKSGDSTLIAVTHGNTDTPRTTCTWSGVSTTADQVLDADRGHLSVRDAEAGTYTTRLSDGTTAKTTLTRVPTARTAVNWKLNVTSWQAGDGPNDTHKVALTPRTLTADDQGALPDWQNVAGLQSTSGTAVYKTTVDVGPSWSGGTGAYLDLGDVRGTASVTVNGRALPPINQVDPNGIDLRDYLHAGNNTLEVHLSTLLGNAAYGGHQAYGLLGPVRLRPYGEATITARCTARAY